ncbi:Alpha/Beta hydrolase protein [Immersiella caudata]|uniref:Alpha/Beta hydrolase protein n=1 Tax=Immersiella caudata TaxID=314043 RepID=A0AA39WCX4_9PEZI|nr:Alpha/Beta hydrolase protein [Immersiella caudata]
MPQTAAWVTIASIPDAKGTYVDRIAEYRALRLRHSADLKDSRSRGRYTRCALHLPHQLIHFRHAGSGSPLLLIHFRHAGSGSPLLLIHGNPQHSLTWRIVGPILAEKFTLLEPPISKASSTSSISLRPTPVFSHDKGAGFATALAVEHPSLVKRLGLSEYLPPGFGYESAAAPAAYWDLYANWQIAFFSTPDAAEFFNPQTRKGDTPVAFSEDLINRYTSAISKPGFLRGMLGPFDVKTVTADAALFKGIAAEWPLSMLALALGGDVVPQAGH